MAGRTKMREISVAESQFLWSVSDVFVFTCNERLDLVVFSFTLNMAPLSLEDLSAISSAALRSLGVSGLRGAAGT